MPAMGGGGGGQWAYVNSENLNKYDNVSNTYRWWPLEKYILCLIIRYLTSYNILY